jgi:hypothetical protein
MAAPGRGRIERRSAAILATGTGRREFIALVAGAAVACLRPALAQQGKGYRIGLLD